MACCKKKMATLAVQGGFELETACEEPEVGTVLPIAVAITNTTKATVLPIAVTNATKALPGISVSKVYF